MSLLDEAQQEQVDENHRKTIRRLQRNLAIEKSRTDEITEAIYKALSDGIAGLELPPVEPPEKDRRRSGEETAVVVWSDWQLGKATPSYGSEVCEERIERYCQKADRIVDVQRQDHPVKRVALFLLGDMIEGELIFPGQAHEIDSSLYEQVAVDGPRILGAGVRWAASRFEHVDVYAVPGNHGYLGGRARRDYHPLSNGDRMLYTFVEQLTADLDNVDWHVTSEWWQVADLGDKCRFMLLHGDQVRGWAGVPWYGWTKKVLAWSSLSSIWPEMQFDHVAAGHFHTPVSMYVNGRRLWINASTESHNPYALEQLAAAGEPAQWLMFVKPGKGVTAEYLVDLK